MPSPFPGMDPYLEQVGIWHDFHKRFLPAAAAQLTAIVLPRYIALINEHAYLNDPDLDAPAEVRLPELDRERESFLTLLDRASRRVVTVIELLSPANKRRGANRRRYLAKRADLLSGSAHLVEIDLLRGGPPMPADGRPDCEYSILVSRADDRPRAGFWPIRLREPLPIIPIPLGPDDLDARLNLRDVLDRVYDEAGYRYFLYDQPPEPPLTDVDAMWADDLRRRAATSV